MPMAVKSSKSYGRVYREDVSVEDIKKFIGDDYDYGDALGPSGNYGSSYGSDDVLGSSYGYGYISGSGSNLGNGFGFCEDPFGCVFNDESGYGAGDGDGYGYGDGSGDGSGHNYD